MRLPVYIKHYVCVSVTFCLSPRGDKHFYIHGGKTFSSSGGSGNDDFDCDEEEDEQSEHSCKSSNCPGGP